MIRLAPYLLVFLASIAVAQPVTPEALTALRKAAAGTGSETAAANIEIFGLHNSWSRGDFDKAPIVTRAEGEHALRKAAELGDPYAMRRLATLLSRGPIVKRDLSEAIVWRRSRSPTHQRTTRRKA